MFKPKSSTMTLKQRMENLETKVRLTEQRREAEREKMREEARLERSFYTRNYRRRIGTQERDQDEEVYSSSYSRS